MYSKLTLLLVALAMGCSALPAQLEDAEDMSIFFEHVDLDSRLVGGIQAAAGSHPHMVAMTDGILIRSFMCGGSVITQHAVLTAAHCIRAAISWGSLSSNLRVTVGTNLWNSGGQTYTLNRFANHELYDNNNIKHDIGILFTTNVIQLTALVRIIPLSYNYVGGGVPARVAGWGRIRAGGALSPSLLEINTHTIEGNRCVTDVVAASASLNIRAPHVDPAIELCTFHSVGVGNCNGDSGSALVRTDNGQQVGIVSWGFPCALGAPDMFVRVSAYRDWILSRI